MWLDIVANVAQATVLLTLVSLIIYATIKDIRRTPIPRATSAPTAAVLWYLALILYALDLRWLASLTMLVAISWTSIAARRGSSS